MKIYEFVGNGLGVPGLPRTIKQSEGDQWIKDFEKALKEEKAYLSKIFKIPVDELEGPYQAQQMPGAILKGALANGNFIAKSTIKEKSSFGKPPKEKESE